MNIKKLIFLLVLVPISTYASKGRGGQYMFYDTDVLQKLESAQKLAINMVKEIPDEALTRLFPKEINKESLIKILKNIKHSPTKFDRTRNGYPLVLDYIEENGVKKIEVLGRFYELILYEKYSGSIEQNLIHEALHFFDYDQEDAWETSHLITKLYENGVGKFCNKMLEVEPTGRCLFVSKEEDKITIRSISDNFFKWLESGQKSPIKVFSPGRVRTETRRMRGPKAIFGFNLNESYNVTKVPLTSLGDNNYQGIITRKMVLKENCFSQEFECFFTVFSNKGEVAVNLNPSIWGELPFSYNVLNGRTTLGSKKRVNELNDYFRQSFILDAQEAIFVVD